MARIECKDPFTELCGLAETSRAMQRNRGLVEFDNVHGIRAGTGPVQYATSNQWAEDGRASAKLAIDFWSPALLLELSAVVDRS
jgi:hypothetical protein